MPLRQLIRFLAMPSIDEDDQVAGGIWSFSLVGKYISGSEECCVVLETLVRFAFFEYIGFRLGIYISKEA